MKIDYCKNSKKMVKMLISRQIMKHLANTHGQIINEFITYI